MRLYFLISQYKRIIKRGMALPWLPREPRSWIHVLMQHAEDLDDSRLGASVEDDWHR